MPHYPAASISVLHSPGSRAEMGRALLLLPLLLILIPSHHTTPHHTPPPYTIPHYTTPHHTTPHHTLSHIYQDNHTHIVMRLSDEVLSPGLDPTHHTTHRPSSF